VGTTKNLTVFVSVLDHAPFVFLQAERRKVGSQVRWGFEERSGFLLGLLAAVRNDVAQNFYLLELGRIVKMFVKFSPQLLKLVRKESLLGLRPVVLSFHTCD